MKLEEVREKYLKFFEKHGHVVIDSAPIVPEDDPTTLFTSSGMQPLLPYFLDKEHPKGKKIANSQKCFRAEDIEEVGDNRHTTYFEMLGNWSFGDYFKQEQIPWFFEFLTKEIGLDPEKLYVTVFEGDEKAGIPKDTESAQIWKGLLGGDERVSYYGADKNWWSRSGTPENMPAGEPGGTDTEVFYDFGKDIHTDDFGKECHPNCECGRFMEIGNSVFMEYVKQEDGSFTQLPTKNVDFGGGLERITAASNNDSDIFNIDTIALIIKRIEEVSGKKYNDNKKAFRVIADHVRGAEVIIKDGVTPSNTEQGYVLRRLIRRAVRFGDMLSIKLSDITDGNQEIIQEEEKFRKTLEKGLKEFEKISKGGSISGSDAFVLFTTYGFPLELTLELALEQNLNIDEAEFRDKMREHQALSRKGAQLKFKGGLADHSEASTKYHTATHLLLRALKDVLGEEVAQKGSNITQERMRFDFSWGEKLTDEQKQKVESIVNQKIKEGLNVTNEEKEGVITYSIGDYSIEPCGGPHIKNTSELGHFKIKKEEASSAGVRRIKAILE
ncbi:MAG: alanine--tRNA ligase [Parcubacteria group bacterium]|nr:alanine--tRNA ligase [Parcubacteria group bacterium]